MNINAIDLRHLRYFVAVAEELHFGRAAKRLNISQPPLSQQIMTMENYMGVKLFRRSNRRVELTPAGHYLLPEARHMLGDLNRLAQQTKQAESGLTGHLRVGVNFSAPLHPFTGKLLRQFRKQYPGVQLELQLHERPNILQLVDIASSELDLALIWLDHDHHKSSILRVDLESDPLDVVVPTDHPLAKCSTVEMRKLADYPIIAPPRDAGTQLYEGVMSAFARINREPKIMYEAIQMPIVMSMVAAGDRIALLPRFLSNIPIRGIKFIPLKMPRGKPPQMTFNLIGPQNPKKTYAAHFIEVAKKLAYA